MFRRLNFLLHLTKHLKTWGNSFAFFKYKNAFLNAYIGGRFFRYGKSSFLYWYLSIDHKDCILNIIHAFCFASVNLSWSFFLHIAASHMGLGVGGGGVWRVGDRGLSTYTYLLLNFFIHTLLKGHRWIQKIYCKQRISVAIWRHLKYNICK